MAAGLREREAQEQVAEAVVGLGRDEHAGRGRGLVEAARVVEVPVERVADERRERRDLQGAARDAERLVEAPLHAEEEGEPQSPRHVVRVQLLRAAEVALALLPVQVVRERGEAERGPALGPRGVQAHRLARGLERRRAGLGEGEDGVDAEHVVVVADAGVGECVVGVERDGAAEVDERAREALLVEGVPVVAPAHVLLVGAGVVRPALLQAQALAARELRDEGLGHLLGDGVFELQNVGRLLVELPGPHGRARAHVQELHRHAQGSTRAPDAAFENIRDAEFAPRRERVGVLTAVAEHAARRAEREAAEAPETRDERVG